jgi:3-oxoadipate enol-lactonase
MQNFYKSKYGNVYYDLSGPEDAPVVIFLHGVGMDHRTFEKQREALHGQYRTLLIDLPGHGHSSIENYDKRYSLVAAECLEGLMDEAGIDKAIIIGQSLGSFISQRFQLKNPDRVIATAHIGGAELKSYAGGWAKALIPITMGMINIMPENSFFSAFGRHKADTIEAQEYLIETTKKTGKKLISAITKDMLYEIIEGIPEPEYRHLMISFGETELSFIRKNSLYVIIFYFSRINYCYGCKSHPFI